MFKILLFLLIFPFEIHALEIPGPEGVTVEMEDEAPYRFVRLRAVGESDLLIGDRRDVQRATKVATLKAKAAIARYLGEDVKTEEFVEQISESAQQSNGKTTTVSRNDVEKLVETIRNSSSEYMKGILVLEQNVDQRNKRVIVTVGTSDKSQRTADLMKKAFNRDSTYRSLLPGIATDEIQSEVADQEVRRSEQYDEF
jgi:hypothetical protein